MSECAYFAVGVAAAATAAATGMQRESAIAAARP